MSFEEMPEAAAGRVVGMRRNHQTGGLCSPKLGHVIEGVDALSRGIEIKQQDVLVRDRTFDARNQGNSAGSGVSGKVAHVEPAIVQRNGQDVIPKAGRPVDQVGRRVRDVVVRVG